MTPSRELVEAQDRVKITESRLVEAALVLARTLGTPEFKWDHENHMKNRAEDVLAARAELAKEAENV